MSEIYTINRYVVLIRPSAELITWANTVFPEGALTYQEKMQDENTTVYLIPEMDDLDDAYDWLKDNYLLFLENTLEELYDDPDTWPEVMDWATFESLIDYSIQSTVLDLVSVEEDEEYDDDDYYDDDDEEVDGFPADKDDELDWE